jgi:peptidyl-prolyl cis-trans isomerase C
MRFAHNLWWIALTLALSCELAAAQTPPPMPPPQPAKPPAEDNTVAARVNGQPISEANVQRSLHKVPEEKRAEARAMVLKVFIDNLLIEQYLTQLQVAVDTKEVDKKIEEIRTELGKKKIDYAKWLKEMSLTEAELREKIGNDLRWSKHADSQTNEKQLRELFDANKEMFDGSMVRARHILLTPAANDPKADAQAQADLKAFKQQIEKQVADGLTKLPKESDALAKEKARMSLTEEAFAAMAKEKSACPTKDHGGDVGLFMASSMVEPFSKAAFALKPYQMSDVVKTEFGYHLILVTEHRAPAREIKFEDVKEEVKEVFSERLRDQVIARVRPKAKIEITPAK